MAQEEAIKKDELTQLIAERLGERKRKIQRMQEMEHASKIKNQTIRCALYVMAACLVVGLILWPWNGLENPIDALGIDMTATDAYRAATPQSEAIASLIDEGKYEDAQKKVIEAIEESEYNLSVLRTCLEEDDESEYLISLELSYNAELRWLHACIQVKNEDYKAAEKELKRYLRHDEYCDHKNEARLLLEEIKKR